MLVRIKLDLNPDGSIDKIEKEQMDKISSERTLPSEKFGKIKHSVPMLSIQNAKNKEEIIQVMDDLKAAEN